MESSSILGFIMLICVIGCIPAAIAKSKGQSFFLWWIYGALLFIIALVHSLLLKPDPSFVEKEQLSIGMKKCPFCAEMIKSEALFCRCCSKQLAEIKTREDKSSTITEQKGEQHNKMIYQDNDRRSNKAEQKCPSCGKTLTEDESMRGVCPSCHKIF